MYLIFEISNNVNQILPNNICYTLGYKLSVSYMSLCSFCIFESFQNSNLKRDQHNTLKALFLLIE